MGGSAGRPDGDLIGRHLREAHESSRGVRAMVLRSVGEPLHAADVPEPEVGPEEVILRVHTCAVCRTDLHVVDGELPDPKLPLIPGYQIDGGYAGYAAVRYGGRPCWW